MHKPELFRLVVNNFEFINLVIHDSSFENRNELVERLATIKRGGLSDIYRIVFWSDFWLGFLEMQEFPYVRIFKVQ